jgi:hypothetical protein
VSDERDVSDEPWEVVEQRIAKTVRKAPRRKPKRIPKRKPPQVTTVKEEVARAVGKRMRWLRGMHLRGDTGYVRSRPVKTMRAVARRLADDTTVNAEVWNQVRPRHENERTNGGLPKLMMCVDCERQCVDDACVCGGTRLVDHMECDGCGATEVPSELLIGDKHGTPGSRRSCQGRWRVEW